MALRLYDTFSRQKMDFAPIDPANVRLYVCGPTVYDFAHIGNARPIIVFDVLFRLLRHLYGEDPVTYARNITDVDDKINLRAYERGITIRQLTEGTAEQFHKDIAALGVLPPTSEPRATDHMAQMRDLIDRLVARGVAYVAEDHVLFSVDSIAGLPTVPRYGSLARRSLDEMLAGARVDVAPYKRDPMDFVLWKPSREVHEPGWPSPAGIAVPGRPGWHIECSAMSMAKLLEPFGGGLACDDPQKNIFDIHGGGIDLVFPHHENEIAQTCCALDTPRMANIWMHNGFLQVEGQKMSKSLGNFVTIRDLLDDWPGEVLRLNMLKTHYRQPIDWTTRSMEESRSEIHEWVRVLSTVVNELAFERAYGDGTLPEPDEAVLSALSDDLNTPGALAAMRELVKIAQTDPDAAVRFLVTAEFLGLLRPASLAFHTTGWESRNLGHRTRLLAAPYVEAFRVAAANDDVERTQVAIQGLKDIGVRPKYNALTGDIILYGHDVDEEAEIVRLLDERLAARSAKNWPESDRIRDRLAAMGVAVKDNKDGTTTWEMAQ